MTESNDTIEPSCSGECSGCGADEPVDTAAVLTGGRLAMAAASTFLVPLILAIAGAAVAGEGREIHQFVGAAAGLVLGALLVAVATRLLGPREEKAV